MYKSRGWVRGSQGRGYTGVQGVPHPQRFGAVVDGFSGDVGGATPAMFSFHSGKMQIFLTNQ